MWGTELINIITYIIAFIISIIGIIGAIVPVLPGPPISFISILLPYLLCTPAPFTGRFIITWLIITTIVTLIDNFLAPAIVKATGGSKNAVFYSIAGMIIGMLFFPPFGIIIGAFVGAFIAEYSINKKSLGSSIIVALGAFGGFIIGTGLKLTTSFILLYYLFKSITLL